MLLKTQPNLSGSASSRTKRNEAPWDGATLPLVPFLSFLTLQACRFGARGEVCTRGQLLRNSKSLHLLALLALLTLFLALASSTTPRYVRTTQQKDRTRTIKNPRSPGPAPALSGPSPFSPPQAPRPLPLDLKGSQNEKGDRSKGARLSRLWHRSN